MRGLQAHSRAAMANSSSAASCRTRLLHGNYKHRQLVKELLGHYKNYQMRTKACFQANVVSQPQVSASRKAGLRSPAADAARQPMLSCHTQSPATSWQLYRHTMRHIGCSASSAAAATAQAPPAAAQEQQSSTTTHLQRLRDSFQIHNTMTRCKEHFQPRPDMGDKVQMYVCGVTVYDYSHIGHARVYVAFDVLYRLLGHLQYDVQYVRNFTDIDDKIIKRAAASGEDSLALSARFIDEFHKDMQALGCLPPTHEPKATDHIGDMVATISKIIDNGHAYVLPDGDVYFEVATLSGYGRLSGRAQEDNRAGERVAVDTRKRGLADFALWKSAKPGEPAWASPWGSGRPGWHIECSSMIAAIMGDVIDIHGGGRDLVFPHHENELAQSQAAGGPCSCGNQHNSKATTGSSNGSSEASSNISNHVGFVRYWVHNGFVNVDSEKMSKSLGNFFTIRDVLRLYHPAALRWFLISSQYRAPINYTQKALDDASDRFYYVYQSLADVAATLAAAGEQAAAAIAAASTQSGVGSQIVAAVVEGLLDDLNTPACLSALSQPLKAVNDLMTTKAGRKNPKRLQLLAEYQAGLTQSLALLGLGRNDISATLQEFKSLSLVRSGLTQDQVDERMAARAAARQAKDFAAADAVRLELAAKGIMLMDTAQGTTWRPGLPQ